MKIEVRPKFRHLKRCLLYKNNLTRRTEIADRKAFRQGVFDCKFGQRESTRRPEHFGLMGGKYSENRSLCVRNKKQTYSKTLLKSVLVVSIVPVRE